MVETKKNTINKRIDSDIKEIENKIELLKQEQKKLIIKKDKLKKVSLYTLDDSKELIKYLTNSIENENYTIEEINLNVKSSSYNVDHVVSQYTLLYLVKEDKKEEALKEIKEQYGIKDINGEYYISSNKVSDIDKSNNYVRLSLYNRYSDYMVSFNPNNFKHGIITIDINDDKYKYIKECMYIITSRKMDKEDLSLTMFEMKKIADEYITKNNYSKKLTKKISE